MSAKPKSVTRLHAASHIQDSRPRSERKLLTLPECAQELSCSVRFLQLEIERGRLVATRLSNRLLRVRDRDWQAYLDRGATRKIG